MNACPVVLPKVLRNHIVEPCCPVHGDSKTRKGKKNAAGVTLLFCADCVQKRARESYERRSVDLEREAEAFRKIDEYLAEQAEAVAIRSRLAACSYQCPLGSTEKRLPIARPNRTKAA